ncbi:MAG: ATP-binding protein [Candidatus Magnetominusculus sp. LBB02]|nr:ATP-binding protein [Candidatus Magnetominusculus sp. LBB02]
MKFVSLNTKLTVFGLFCLIMLGVSFYYDLRSTGQISEISLSLQKAAELRWQMSQFNMTGENTNTLDTLVAQLPSNDLLNRYNALRGSAPDKRSLSEFNTALDAFTSAMQADYQRKLAALTHVILYMAVFFFFMVVLAIIVARTIVTRPLLRIIKAVATVAGGDFHTRINLRSNDEIGQLARYFNVMTDALDSSFNEMEILASFPEKNPSPILGLLRHEGQLMITYVNPAAETLLNADKLDKSELIPPRLSETIERLISENKGAAVCEITVKDKTFIQYIHLLNDNETIRIFSYDITERKLMEDRLKKYADNLEQNVKDRTKELHDAKLLAEAASRTKSGFLANMSHELRTPLNSVIGFSQVLIDRLYGELNAQQEQYLNNILNSGNHLLALINEVLDLSRIEAGKMELERSLFRIGQLINSSAAMFKERAMAKNIKLTVEIDAAADINLDGDERRIKQVLYNLLSNAIKFTDRGGWVKITVSLISRSAGESFIETAVEDSGIGIMEGDIKRLFAEFTQLDSSYTKKYEGAGLGLALSKKLIDLHGGTIGVTSEFGKGSRFYFTIPVTGQ